MSSPKAAELSFAVPAEAEHEQVADLLAHAFGFPRDDAAGWFARAGVENMRVLRRGSRIAAALLEIPMAQYFGGRSVPTMGVAGVGVSPEERGRGTATAMMVAMLREARAKGIPLSTLYPASLTLYRKSGYERAGALYQIEIDPRIGEIARVPGMTIAEAEGLPAPLQELYRAVSTRATGHLDRGPYIWSRITQPRGMVTKTFTVSHGAALEGYVVVSHANKGGISTAVTATDLVATTARAAQAILRFLSEYRSLAATVSWKGAPSDVFVTLLPERYVKIEVVESFMLRVVDPVRALAARGWPRTAGGALVLDLADASLPENSGRLAVTLEGGRARVEPTTARPDVTLHERALAALYSGQAAPHVLATAGWLDGAPAALDTLETWLAGPSPICRDFF